MLLENGCWLSFRRSIENKEALPCIFLDRDGVVVEDAHYLSRLEDIAIIPGAAAFIRHANRQGWLCGLVTNQAGIGKGVFDWNAFAAVQDEIERRLALEGAVFDFVVACPFHDEAVRQEYRQEAHPWRKPRDGMLRAVMAHYSISVDRSVMAGDRLSDLQAGAAAGVNRLAHVMTGHGGRERAAVLAWADKRTDVSLFDDVSALLPALQDRGDTAGAEALARR